MKRIIGIGIFTLCVLLNACEIHEYDNGDLQGFWHLESIDTLHSGGKNDLSQKRLCRTKIIMLQTYFSSRNMMVTACTFRSLLRQTIYMMIAT